MIEGTFEVAIKYGAFLFGYGALGVKFIILLSRYHSCGDYKHGVALLRLVGLGCSTCGTTFVKVAVEGRERRAVGACLVLSITGVRSGIPCISSMAVGKGWCLRLKDLPSLRMATEMCYDTHDFYRSAHGSCYHRSFHEKNVRTRFR